MNTNDPTRDLLTALDVATGRNSAAPGVSSDALLAFARRLVATGRVIAADTPCPTPWIRRAEALFAPRRSLVGAALWSILFDSARTPSTATRGAPRARFLRLGGDGGSLEAELVAVGTPDARLVGTLAGAARATAIVLEPSAGTVVRAPVTAEGAFELPVPRRATSFTLSVRVGRRVIARSESVALPTGSGPP